MLLRRLLMCFMLQGLDWAMYVSKQERVNDRKET